MPIFDVFSSLFGANTQAQAAESAQKLQAQEAANALDFQKQEWTTEQGQLAPYTTAGGGAIQNLAQMVNEEAQGKGPLAPWTGTFTAPTAAEAEATPGYQFEKQQELEALQNSAAASGNIESGGTLKATTNYAEGLASTNYEQAFQNALTQYQTAYNTFQNNQQNLFNRTAGVAQGGQQAVTASGQLGQQAATNVGNISLTTGAQQGADIQNAAYQTASGYTGATNALTGAGSSASALMILQQLLSQGAIPGMAT